MTFESSHVTPRRFPQLCVFREKSRVFGYSHLVFQHIRKNREFLQFFAAVHRPSGQNAKFAFSFDCGCLFSYHRPSGQNVKFALSFDYGFPYSYHRPSGQNAKSPRATAPRSLRVVRRVLKTPTNNPQSATRMRAMTRKHGRRAFFSAASSSTQTKHPQSATRMNSAKRRFLYLRRIFSSAQLP